MNTTGKFEVIGPQSLLFSKVLALDLEHFPKPWAKKDWLELNWHHFKLFVFSESGEVLSFALFQSIPGDDAAHLLKICVRPSHRGSLVSSQFWQSCLQELKKSSFRSIYLEVESPNQRAIGFYQKVGFQTLRLIKGYYSDGTDALTMQMTI